MKSIFIVFIFVLFIFKVNGQVNLIPNPSFRITMPDTCGDFNMFADSITIPWKRISLSNAFGVPSFSTCTPDLLRLLPNGFGGVNELPHSGFSCVSLMTFIQNNFIRTFLETKFESNLKKNRKYCSNLFLSLADSAYFACNDFGFYFSADSINEMDIDIVNQNIFPQIENNPQTNPLTNRIGWKEVKGIYIANGTEQYLTIGNFKSQAETDTTILPNWTVNTWYSDASYLIDDVSVTEIRALKTNNDDTSYCANAVIEKILSVYPDFFNVVWSTGDTSHSIVATTSGTYWVRASSECGTITDTFKIKILDANSFNFDLGRDTIFCKGFSTTLAVSNSNLNNYLWSTSDTTQSITITKKGIYFVEAQSLCGIVRDTIAIDEYSLPSKLINQNDTIIFVGDSLNLDAQIGLENYLWSTNQSTSSITITNYSQGTATYSLFANTINGCLVSDSIFIEFKAKPDTTKERLPLIIPNPQILTKAGGFEIINLPKNSHVFIYDGLGKTILVNQKDSIFSADIFSSGIYYYSIFFEDGNNIKGKILLLKN